MDLYLLKGNSVLFITAGILLNDICKYINKKDELKLFIRLKMVIIHKIIKTMRM